MLKEQSMKITMAEGDYGEELPFVIKGENIEENDIFEFKIKKADNVIIKKEYTLTDNVFLLSFTEEESKLLTTSNYEWGLKQFREGKLVNTIVLSSMFSVLRGV